MEDLSQSNEATSTNIAVPNTADIRTHAETDRVPDLELLGEKGWQVATGRLKLLRPAIEAGPPYLSMLSRISKENNIGRSTLYRWLEQYLENRDTAGLMPKKHQRRRSRLSLEVRELIRFVYDDFYATKQQRSVIEGIRKVQYECFKLELDAPHANSIRKHFKEMQALSGTRTFLRLRGQKKRSEDRYTLRDGVFSGNDTPWARVQVDHTRLDVMIVDEQHRLTVGRPFLTYAVDSNTRVILGFNISLDPSGRLSTGLCLLQAMLPKDAWLKEHGIDNLWPCYGKPGTLHFDNGKEFLSEWIQRACERYDIIIEHRPIATPHFGPQIERAIRTLNTFLRGLSGATFSNPVDRGDYDSDKLAKFTLSEIEGIITEWITGTYHKRVHRGLSRPPINAYNEAVLGAPNSVGIGRRVLEYDQRRLRLDFMPTETRTVQHYGVTFDYLNYSGDSLAPYVGAVDEVGRSKKFYFHRDPRRISEIYFYADDVNEFYPLHPQQLVGEMNLWDWQAQIRRSKQDGRKEVDVAGLYDSMRKLQIREAAAAERSKVARRNTTRRLHHDKVIPLPIARTTEEHAAWDDEIEPFDDIRML